jgi:hypothetical protein
MLTTQLQKGSLLGESRTKVAPYTIKEITPFGLKIERNDSGQFTGAYTANVSDTLTFFLKNDGTFDWESKALSYTKEGDFIIAHVHGTGRMNGPTSSTAEGEAIFMTQSPKLSWLNNRKFKVEATGDLATMEDRAKFFVL